MMNKVMLIGRLGSDPEVRYIPDGTMVVNFSMATDESWKNKSGERVQKTEWHKIEAWGKLAETCSEYLKKGALIFIEGKIKTQSWEDKEGVKRYTTKIQAMGMKMLDKREGSTQTSKQQEHYPDGREIPMEDDDIPF
jgi:single-strand DNA-binding protein